MIFVINTLDKEIHALEASNTSFTGGSVRNLMALTVEARFNSQVTPAPIEFLNDSGRT